MNYDLTPERKDYVNARGFTLLTAFTWQQNNLSA